MRGINIIIVKIVEKNHVKYIKKYRIDEGKRQKEERNIEGRNKEDGKVQ